MFESTQSPEVRFTVPGAPVPKGRPRGSVRRGKGGKLRVSMRTPEKTVAYEQTVGLVAQAARPRGWPMRCAYKVSFTAYPAVDNADIDNYLKAALDGAQGVLWANDKTVRRLGDCEVKPHDPAPRMEVFVEALPVKCSRDACSTMTLYPDDDGRCAACHVQHRKPAKAAARRA